MAGRDDDPKLSGREYEESCRLDELIAAGLAEVDRQAQREAQYRPQFDEESG